jgi:DNA-binding NarL/FixJ family response regulator
MYAIYKSDFEVDFAKNKEFYESFSSKWAEKDNIYFKSFNKKVSEKQSSNNYYSYLLLGIACIVIGFLTGKYSNNKKDNFQDLSVQERKVFRMLKNGASNKEISEEFNIGISTVKSHVSSILSKMSVKSRKELMRSK